MTQYIGSLSETGKQVVRTIVDNGVQVVSDLSNSQRQPSGHELSASAHFYQRRVDSDVHSTPTSIAPTITNSTPSFFNSTEGIVAVSVMGFFSLLLGSIFIGFCYRNWCGSNDAEVKKPLMVSTNRSDGVDNVTSQDQSEFSGLDPETDETQSVKLVMRTESNANLGSARST